LTHQLRVAIHYASLITDACPAADQRTVEIHVPLFHFQPVKMWELEFEDEDYKMLLYCSRRDERYPKELSKKLAVHGVVHGMIGHCHNKAFGKMDAYTQITPGTSCTTNQCLIGTGRLELVKIAQQHVWIRPEAVTQLEEDVKDKVFLRKAKQRCC
jgi:hypothetical protein